MQLRFTANTRYATIASAACLWTCTDSLVSSRSWFQPRARAFLFDDDSIYYFYFLSSKYAISLLTILECMIESFKRGGGRMKKTHSPPKEVDVTELLKQAEMSVAEAAKVLELSPKTVYRLIDENALVVSRRKTATMGVFISTASILKFMREVQLRHIPAKVR